MSTDLTQVSHEDIARLTVDERLKLISDIQDTLTGKNDPFPLTDEEKRILDERLAEYDANPNEGRPWDEVMAEIRQKWLKL